LDAVMAAVKGADVFVSVAAVSDWRVANASDQKIKKSEVDQQALKLEFTENPDILASVAALPAAPYCVGFAAETQDIETYAKAKLAKKKIPLIVANDATHAMGADHNTLMLVEPGGTQRLEPLPKLAAARLLIAEIARRIAR
jgi:phosphopantothenoylcysteine decarboxylase/phosphopantothenate--cysteine ligase